MPSPETIDTLVIVIVMGAQSGSLIQQLRKEDYRFTEVDSSGGFLMEPTVCLFIGLNQTRLEGLLEAIRRCCHTRLQYIPARMEVSTMQGQPLMIEAEVGGAVIFAFEVERYEQL